MIANGKLNDLQLSQHLPDSNQADLLAIGKAALANPDFVKRGSEQVPLAPFTKGSLYPNPSLFSDAKHRMYLEMSQKI